jgi:hypothetical protein
VRQTIVGQGDQALEVWCARPDDVIFGKLLAWDEGRSRRHETDIYEVLLMHYLENDPAQPIDEAYLDAQAEALGPDVTKLWQAIKASARRAAEQDRE